MPLPDLACDPTRCPLCGQANQCAMEIGRATGVEQPPCWCTEVKFSQDLISRLPSPALGQACICRGCTAST